MQAVYFPTFQKDLIENESFFVKCNHDEYSLWFNIFKSKEEIQSIEQPLAISIVSRNRLAQLNDKNRNNMFIDILKQVNFNQTKKLLLNLN